jgi:hypothetical protein
MFGPAALVVTLSQYDAVIGMRTIGVTPDDAIGRRSSVIAAISAAFTVVIKAAGFAQSYVAQLFIPIPRKRYSVVVVPIPCKLVGVPSLSSVFFDVLHVGNANTAAESAAAVMSSILVARDPRDHEDFLRLGTRCGRMASHEVPGAHLLLALALIE